MAAHIWVVEEVDGGPVGTGDFWTCTGCGAGGGPSCGKVVDSEPRPFFPGPALDLPDDCDEARKVIAAHKATPKWKVQSAESKIWSARWVLRYLEQRDVGVTGTVGHRGSLTGGIEDPAGDKSITTKGGYVLTFTRWFELVSCPEPEDRCGDGGWDLTFNGQEPQHLTCFNEIMRRLYDYYEV